MMRAPVVAIERHGSVASIPGMFEIGPDPVQTRFRVYNVILVCLERIMDVSLLFFIISYVPHPRGILYALLKTVLVAWSVRIEW